MDAVIPGSGRIIDESELMSRKDLERELRRLRRRPSGGRRSCLDCWSFDSDELSVDALPAWFLALSRGETGDIPGDLIGSEGKRRYLATRDERPWSSEEWIYCFDPALRAWSWWDVTADENGRVCVWVDTAGEGHIPCEELWWALFVSGASTVESLTLEYGSGWSGQPSIGIDIKHPA
ncbi:hypothetical protein ACIBIZ_20455 [Nonomuraea spiralis]|uniref:hypothetical protein n=1 Tax=Nonomuraea spiralis TaxID=46182 RepID=UPI0037A77936